MIIKIENIVNVPNVVKLEYKVICCNFLSHTEYTI